LAPKGRCDGTGFKEALKAATAWLERHVAHINALNVYPVPDGDTGTNMFLTLQAALEEMGDSDDHSVSAMVHKAAYGALMGARGNSGVIFSQLLRGLDRKLDKKESFDARDLAEAFQEAVATAYRAVIKPVEGTILTVAREAAEAARLAAEEKNDLEYLMEKVVAEARASVERTPSLLPVLKEAGVVDAGGEGLFVILEGILRYMKGEVMEAPSFEAALEMEVPAEDEYGYEAVFIIQGENLNVEDIREAMAQMGTSVLVVGDSHTVKVHIHTQEPGTPLNYAARLGSLTRISVENLQEQYQEFLRRSKGAAARERAEAPPQVQEEALPIAVVTVASGEGLMRVFESLGASAVVPGGQTMNPSTEELLKAIEAIPASQVIVLPNNKNIVLAAQQARELSRKEVRVVPTTTIPQGISALLAFNSCADLSVNVANMEKAMEQVQTAEITIAVRDAVINGYSIKKGQVIGLLNGRLTASGENLEEVAEELLRQMRAEDYEIVTVYYGKDIDSGRAQALADRIQRLYPDLEVEVVDGGQPHYHYILSVE